MCQKTPSPVTQWHDYTVVEPINHSEDEIECDDYSKSSSIEINFFKYSSEDYAKKTFDFGKSV